ncbi:MAG: uroporphyrinogen decarboxylase family protein, partial [Armatimonadota bacterium]|nr:uroporphyrinogen decarboxylase family protein [Armatimonadota bacterium]
MDSRERILATLAGEIPDRVGRTDEIWSETLVRWRREGLGQEEDPADRFHFDMGGLTGFDWTLRLPREVLEETDEYVIHRDANGTTKKEYTRESGHTPHWLGHTLKTGRDWFDHKDLLVFDVGRLPPDLRESYEAHRAKGLFVAFRHKECFECAWPVFGQVGVFTMMMDEPETLADIFSTWTDLVIAIAEGTLSSGADFDGAFIFGDMGYRNGTMFSPETYRTLLLPNHTRLCDFFKSHGKPVILHSCGKIESFIPMFIEAGFAAIQPLEAKTGQDVRTLKELHGNKITFFGNMDVRKLSGTREEIEEEIRSKLAVAMRGGGYI